jgi:4-hydroxy-3-methylbut-2-en-1-yl diphosphate reductase
VSGLLVLAPMHVEAVVVRGRRRVLRTGMGPRNAWIAAARAQAIDATAVAVAGICAGVAPELATGDLVCASELRFPNGTVVEVGAAGELAAALRHEGLRVHVGPLLSIDHIAGARERESLRETGVLALDMESAWLAAGAVGRPFAVVRAVADAAGRQLVDPRAGADMLKALASLRRVVPALDAWAYAAPWHFAVGTPADTVAV